MCCVSPLFLTVRYKSVYIMVIAKLTFIGIDIGGGINEHWPDIFGRCHIDYQLMGHVCFTYLVWLGDKLTSLFGHK